MYAVSRESFGLARFVKKTIRTLKSEHLFTSVKMYQLRNKLSYIYLSFKYEQSD